MAALALTILLLTPALEPAVPRQASAQEGPSYLSGNYVDYAPSGMPDFSMCRAAWSIPGSPPQWTHAGPVALANVIWWLDSRAEQGRRAPPEIFDSYPLLTAYPIFGPAFDDHDSRNIGPLVEDLAIRAFTNATVDGRKVSGTEQERLIAAAKAYVASRGAGVDLDLIEIEQPDSERLGQSWASGDPALLSLGVWEQDFTGWTRVGGHFAALAGFGVAWVFISDPLDDRAALNGQGRAIPEDPALHSCRNAPAAHDDAAAVSHDGHRVLAAGPIPGPSGMLVLMDYFNAENQGEAAAFADLNPSTRFTEQSGRWRGGTVVMVLEHVLQFHDPRRAAPTTPTPSPSPSPQASSTSSPTPTWTPTATPRPPSPTDQDSEHSLWLPFLALVRDT